MDKRRDGRIGFGKELILENGGCQNDLKSRIMPLIMEKIPNLMGLGQIVRQAVMNFSPRCGDGFSPISFNTMQP